ncbi:hypothetical protein THAOC_11892 [Thalassiosira oceanica]|uniref:Uncharacterized protein n=1 Tax=Thalassiosira oceanica TaxID=159749 RepID=K0SL91_THAOC|nr:hypothetical protein THAOC_11892 [Thalassiosira oceanica]|eukprot:EJK67113.1 hypothetical protein THAOC_11892 [Thalassiosira oceanica]
MRRLAEKGGEWEQQYTCKLSFASDVLPKHGKHDCKLIDLVLVRKIAHANVHGRGLMSYIDEQCLSMLCLAAIDNDQSFCEEQMCLGSFALRCLHHGEGKFLDGTMDFALLPEYFGGSFDRDYAKKLVVERPLRSRRQDTGLKVGSGVADNHKEEEDENQARENLCGCEQ